MKREPWALMLAMIVLAAFGAEARAGAMPTGGFGGDPPTIVAHGGGGGHPGCTFGGCGGFSGTMSGCFGGCPMHMGMCGFGGFSGCIGGMPCSFGGCLGGGFSGCFGSFPCSFGGGQFSGGQHIQTYTKWSASPGRSYFYRVLHVQTPAPSEATLEFILVHQPDRPKYFYYFDPVDKKYLGRFIIGAKPEQCFNLLPFADRRTNIKEIPESAYRAIGTMPTFPQVIRPRPGTMVEPSLQNVRLSRPPEAIPDELLGLPPEELSLRKPGEK